LWIERRGKMMKLRRMMLRRKTDPKTANHTLCEPAQSKCTRTFHKRHFVKKIYRENPGSVSRVKNFMRACAVEMHMDMSQEAFCAEIYNLD
jgi:hypothetical protein